MSDPEAGRGGYDPVPRSTIRRAILNDPEFKIYMEELWVRLPKFGELAASIPAEAPGSVEWLGRIGKFWWLAREQQGLTRREVAQRIGVETDAVRFLEFGMGYSELGIIDQDGKLNPSAAVESPLVGGYANALGRPELLEQFRDRFSVPPVTR